MPNDLIFPRIHLTPESDVWVGAWWLGFVIIGLLLCLASIPLLAFPRDLPGIPDVDNTPNATYETRDTTIENHASKRC